MQKFLNSRSRVALATLIAAIGFLYFGWGLPPGDARSDVSCAHKLVECSVCHKMQANAATASNPISNLSAMPSRENCVACHQSHVLSGNQQRRFHMGPNSDCLKCHSFHLPDQLKLGVATGSIEAAQKSLQLCEDCHKDRNTPEVSPGHVLAGRLLHGDKDGKYATKPSEFCLDCHERRAPLPFDSRELADLPRFHTAASHAFGIDLIPGYHKAASTLRIQDHIPSAVVTINGKMECQTCHSLTSSEEYLLTKSIEAGLCTDCHDMQRDSTARLVISDYSSQNH